VRKPLRAGAAALSALAFFGRARAAAGAQVLVTDAGDALHRQGCAATGSPPCTLRDAIAFANSRPGKDTVAFAIGTGPATIALDAPLPPITDPAVLDGTTQPGFAGSPLVTLDGSRAGDEAAGLLITAGASTVRAIALRGFRSTDLAAIVLAEKGGNSLLGNFVGVDGSNGGTGILVRSGRNRIGGTRAGSGNVVSGNTGAGLRLRGAGNLVVGNRIGTDAAATRKLGNGGDGIVSAGGNTIGGAAPGARNVVSANGGVGIAAGPADTILGNFVGTDAGGRAAIGNGKAGITGGGRIGGSEGTRPGGPCSGACNLVSGNGGPGVEPAAEATVQGNFIGTDASGTAALPNGGAGVFVNAVGRVTIGGSSAAARNLISGNDGAGIEIAFEAEGVAVRGNLVGTDASAAIPLGNAEGVALRDGARLNHIGGEPGTDGNMIAFNRGAGVALAYSAGSGNAIVGNSIHDNAGLGIDLGRDGPTANHGAEPREGPNGLQNFPILTSVTPYGVEGTFDGAPSTAYTLEFFSSSVCDPSGFGQGQTRIGLTSLTTDDSGHADFGIQVTAPPGQPVTGTATDASGGTSEFSACVLPAAQEP
jgi:hypothetical protein